MTHYANGQFSDEGVSLDPLGPAFRYGSGFFETLLYNGRKVCHLDLHLDRLLHSLRSYGIDYQGVDFEAIIHDVIRRNGLNGEFARVNVFYPAEEPKAHPVILAVPFKPSPYKTYRVCLCSDRHVSTLNAQKTTSYMFFHLAMKEARARGFNDALLLDFDNNLLECTTGALLLEKDGEFVEMDSPYRLPSTALQLANRVLEIESEAVSLDELGAYRHAYILNSLIGMRPIVAIGETAFVPDEEACRTVSEIVLEEGF